ERMIRSDHFRESETAKPHEPARAAPTGQVVDELDRGAIGPMQVLRHQQQRSALGVTVEELAHFTKHPFQVDADQLPKQGFALLRRTQPGQLQQPSWRDGTQQSRHVCITATQLREGFEYRMVGLAASVVLHAMAARTNAVAKPGNEAIDQSRLADAGL